MPIPKVFTGDNVPLPRSWAAALGGSGVRHGSVLVVAAVPQDIVPLLKERKVPETQARRMAAGLRRVPMGERPADVRALIFSGLVNPSMPVVLAWQGDRVVQVEPGGEVLLIGSKSS